ncbi:MAG TPA: CHAT domain-containing protein, partial [Pirellulales bacterium]
GALPGQKSGEYLLEERPLAVIPTPQLLPDLLDDLRTPGAPRSLLLAGDIDYAGDAGAPGASADLPADSRAPGRLQEGKLLSFDRLEAAQAELASIERRYLKKVREGKSDTLEGAAATEEAFREQAGQHEWLHLITHGFFAPETIGSALRAAGDKSSTSETMKIAGVALPTVPAAKPVSVHPGLLSGLAFAGANSTPEEGNDDGILTALEVSALDLSQVDTVVLSACETGLGEVAGGEGLLGLQRAFQVAGAKTVVASLWKVPDRATSTLMQRFYENLWDKKMGKLAALREAQIWMMRDKGNRGLALGDDAPDPNAPLPPFFWAAFVLSGDWR